MAPFTIEFQPIGIRLVCQEPLTALEAARQLNIPLRADCGGNGICGKCIIQVDNNFSDKPTKVELHHLSENQIVQNYRLACETIIAHNTQITIPPASLYSQQVLQTEGEPSKYSFDPFIRNIFVEIPLPSLHDVRSDIQRLLDCLKNNTSQNLTVQKHSIYQDFPQKARKANWKLNVLTHGDEIIHIAPKIPEPILGIALDVGSTKIAGYLLDLQNGELLAAKGVPNPQISFGEDIMARIDAAVTDQSVAKVLHQKTLDVINDMVRQLCDTVNQQTDSIFGYCLVGNTAMHHFLLDLPVHSLAVSPFVPVMNSPFELEIESFSLNGNSAAKVFFPPPIAGFVGSDHLAFLLSAEFGESPNTRLAIDIGTNTEIALQSDGRIVSCSTASGPAFEGAHIQYGMRAGPGAIEHIHINDESLNLDIIGDGNAIGICGSGILDAIAEFYQNGIINERGRLDKTHARVKLNKDGKPYFILQNADKDKIEITISQNDIDQILLAKGAIRAGIEILMDVLHVNHKEIEEVVIAGAFGSYMEPEHAKRIGMIPNITFQKIRSVGNAAGVGARMMLLSASARQKAFDLAKIIEYVELTVYPDFALFFANGIRF